MSDTCPRCLTEHRPAWRGRCDPGDLYRAEMGREPPEPDPADPLAWQWEYDGSRAARERLASTLARVSVPDGTSGPPAVVAEAYPLP